MTTTAQVDVSTDPLTLTVLTDQRAIPVSGTVGVGDDEATFQATAVRTVTVTDADRTWGLESESEDRTELVYRAPA